jgi:hypothetical protein
MSRSAIGLMSDQMPDSARGVPGSSKAILAVRGALQTALVGLIVALIALLLLQWPTAAPDDPPLTTGLHLTRITSRMAVEGAELDAGILLDGAIYLVVLAAFALLATVLARGDRRALVSLIALSSIGLIYAGSMAVPFVGPLIATFGFALAVSAGALAWITLADADAATAEPNHAAPETLKSDRTDAQTHESDTGISDYASHSVA